MMDRTTVAARVRHDHAAIRSLLDDVYRACEAARERAVERLRNAVWELHLVFDEHVAMEEAHVAPILRAEGVRGEARAVDMVLEHNEQRRVIQELVEDAESDAKELGELVAEARTLVLALTNDMDVEERSLAVVLADVG